jgi:hypothetical protein
MDESDRLNLCKNIAITIEKIPEGVVNTLIEHLNKITPAFGKQVSQILRSRKEGSAKKTEGENLLKQLQQTLVGK